MLKKVIVLDNLKSNILSEAILILKEDVEINNNIREEANNIKIESAIKEAEYIIEECMYNLEKEKNNKKNIFFRIIDKVIGVSNKK